MSEPGFEATRADGTGPGVGPAAPRPGGGWRPGSVVDRWRLVGLLGAGAMGQVWRVEDVETGAQAALKTVLQGAAPHLVERLKREGEALARVPVHPGVLRVRAAGEAFNQVWLVLDLAPGGSLHERLKRQGPMEPAAAARLVAEVARGVAHVHAHGVLHRDLKASNVLFDADGRALLADFGVARLRGADRLTQTGAAVGTPGSMSPEQAAGDAHVDERTDVYGLGALLYECLTGQPPFAGSSAMHTIARILNEPVLPPSKVRPGVPPAVEEAVLLALAKSPAERPPTAREYADLLERAARGELPSSSSGSATSSIGPALQAARANAARRAFLGAMVLISLVATVVTSVVLLQNRPRPPGEDAPPPPPTTHVAPPLPPTAAPALTGPYATAPGTKLVYELHLQEVNELGSPAFTSLRTEYDFKVPLTLVAGPPRDGATPYQVTFGQSLFLSMGAGAEADHSWLPTDPFEVVLEPDGRVRSVTGLEPLRARALASERVENTRNPDDPRAYSLHRFAKGFLTADFLSRTLTLLLHPGPPWKPGPAETVRVLPAQLKDQAHHLLPTLYVNEYSGQTIWLQDQRTQTGDAERIRCELRLDPATGRTKRARVFEYTDYRDVPPKGITLLPSMAIWGLDDASRQ